MSIDKTIQTLSVLEETMWDELTGEKEDMSEVYLVAISEEDYWALKNAINTLKGLNILNSIYKDEEGS